MKVLWVFLVAFGVITVIWYVRSCFFCIPPDTRERLKTAAPGIRWQLRKEMARINRPRFLWTPVGHLICWIIIIVGVIATVILVKPEQIGDNKMLFKPKWFKLLSESAMPYLFPDNKRIMELERVRCEFNIPHDAFAMRILGSPVTTRKVQRYTLEAFSIQNPGVSERDLLRMVLISRVQASPSIKMTSHEIDKVMERISSFDDLCYYISSLDEEKPDFSDPLGIGKRIDEILAQEEVDKKAPAENLIRLLEQTYSDFRKKYPDQDEHWILAKTWLERYGATQESRQKGPELTRFIAYKDTLTFSVLESPKSIRGLALFLVYKELGEQCCIYYSSEFRQIMEPAKRSMESSVFLDKYKQRNPQTWKEAKAIKYQSQGVSLDLYSHLMGVDSLQYPGGGKLAKKFMNQDKD